MATSASQAHGDSYWLDRRAYRKRTHFGRRPSLHERRREELLQDWYGSDRGKLEVVAHQRPAREIRNVVDQVFSELGRQDIMRLEVLRQHWAELVGVDVARHTSPAGFRGRTLDVEVSSSSWLYVLEHEHKGRILERVKAFTEGGFTALRLVPAGRRRR